MILLGCHWVIETRCHAGDRPIEITLQRAWQALTWRQRLRLLGLLLRSGSVDTSELNAQAVEALKDDDIITSVVAEYSEKFPQVSSRGK